MSHERVGWSKPTATCLEETLRQHAISPWELSLDAQDRSGEAGLARGGRKRERDRVHAFESRGPSTSNMNERTCGSEKGPAGERARLGPPWKRLCPAGFSERKEEGPLEAPGLSQKLEAVGWKRLPEPLGNCSWKFPRVGCLGSPHKPPSPEGSSASCVKLQPLFLFRLYLGPILGGSEGRGKRRGDGEKKVLPPCPTTATQAWSRPELRNGETSQWNLFRDLVLHGVCFEIRDFLRMKGPGEWVHREKKNEIKMHYNFCECVWSPM